MSTRSMLVLGLCLIVCCLILGKSFGEAPLPQQAGQPGAGRYQLIQNGNSSGQFRVVLMDSATGHCWLKNFDATGQVHWEDHGSPAEGRAKGR